MMDGHSDEEINQLCAEARRLSKIGSRRTSGYTVPRIFGRGAAPRQVGAPETPEVLDYLYNDLRSTRDGRDLGRKFQHDPFRLASSLGITVQRVPFAQLQRENRPLITVTGTLWRLPGQPPVVQLVDTLNPWETAKVLGHECGHALGLSDERHADQFSASFLKVDDTESAAGRWRAMEAEKARRARSQRTVFGVSV